MTGQILPAAEAQSVVLSTAKRLKMPGFNGGFIDGTSHMKQLLDNLYASGYCIISLNGQGARDAAGKLNAGQRADV